MFVENVTEIQNIICIIKKMNTSYKDFQSDVKRAIFDVQYRKRNAYRNRRLP